MISFGSYVHEWHVFAHLFYLISCLWWYVFAHIRDRTGIIDHTDNYRPIDFSVLSMVVNNILFDGISHLLEAFSNEIAFKRILG